MERVVISSKQLEEFLERLLRWDELCQELRELYYRYIDLAAFRSEKCYFPGRRCVRSWNRKYDLGDLTLMWTYIANTAPLCGKLMKALAEVEYKMHKKALESLELYGGVEKTHRPTNRYEIRHVFLNKPVCSYLALSDNTLYAIWGTFNGLPQQGQRRAAEIERRVSDILERYRRGGTVEFEVDEYEVDREYERLWLEVPLPEEVSKLLNGSAKAPVALFRNLGWLLSDDFRTMAGHNTSLPGQTTMRIFDWIALMTYGRALQGEILVFKICTHRIDITKRGAKPLLEIRPIGTATELIQSAYERFGIKMGDPNTIISRGYAVIKALRERGLRSVGRAYVVDDVGAWVALSNILSTFILGDGYISPTEFWISAKVSLDSTLMGPATRVKELASALGGVVHQSNVKLKKWHMRLLLSMPVAPIFEKSIKALKSLVEHPAGALVQIDGAKYLLTFTGYNFGISKRKAPKLYDLISRIGMRVRIRGNIMVISYHHLKKLARHGAAVRLLNELEKDVIREVKPVLRPPDLDGLRKLLKELGECANIRFNTSNGRPVAYITLCDKSMIKEVSAKLRSVGIRHSITKNTIYIRARESLEIIKSVFSENASCMLYSVATQKSTRAPVEPKRHVPLTLYIFFVKAVPAPLKAENLYT